MTWNKGDKVAIATNVGFGEWYYQIETVHRITKTQAVLMDGRKFNKRTGRQVGGKGDPWSTTPYIEPVTPAIHKHNAKYKEDQHKRALIHVIRNANLSDLSVETLEAIVRLCKDL